MYKAIIVCSLLTGVLNYAHSAEAQLSSLKEFNAAYPPSAEVSSALEKIDSIIPAQNNALKLFKNRYASKLEHRALACSQFVFKDEVDQKNIEAQSIKRNDCLKVQDEQLLQLIGVSLVGFRSTQPPLRPLVRLGSPYFIPHPDGMHSITGKAASKSNVAVLNYGSSYGPGEYISYEIPSGNKIANLSAMQTDSFRDVALSPNGRITAFRKNGLSFIDNETGQELWQARFGDFYGWFPEMQMALVNRTINGDSKLWLIDFKTGEIVPYSVAYNGQRWALPISESPSRFLIGSYGGFSLIENIRTAAGVIGKVVKDYKLVNSSISENSPILMQNGKSIFFNSNLGSGNFFFTLFNLKSSEEKLFDTGNFLIKNDYAKLSEETVLVGSNSGTNFAYQAYAFDIKNSTLSCINNDNVRSSIISGIQARVGFMNREHRGMLIGDELILEPPVSLTSIVTTDKLQRELYALEEDAGQQRNNPFYKTNIAEKKAQLIGKIPANAKVQAIGIYQAKLDGLYRRVNVTIKRTDKPLVLMLNSGSPSHWNLIKEPGANLAAVIVTCVSDSKVIGAGSTKTIMMRIGNYAYKQDSPEYINLNNDAISWTGKPISKFQGAYDTTSFSVGD
jgi:hypothetical protein